MQGKKSECKKCGWIGSNPVRVGVGTGHSFKPVRYFCPECRSGDLVDWTPQSPDVGLTGQKESAD